MKTKYRMDRLEERFDGLHRRVNEVEYLCNGFREMSVKTGGKEYNYNGKQVPSYTAVEIKAVLEALLDHLNLTASIVPPQGQKVALQKVKP